MLEHVENPNPNNWRSYPVDLNELDKLQNSKPIFTRELLQHIADSRDLILKSRPKTPIKEKSLDGKDRVIWKALDNVPEHNEEDRIQIMYLTYPQMAPAFLREVIKLTKEGKEFGGATYTLLRKYNADLTIEEKEKLVVPICLNSVADEAKDDTTPERQALLSATRKRCQTLKAKWERSMILEKMNQLFTLHANDTIPIHKILCFGLGSIAKDHNDKNDTILQHLAIRTIADALDTIYSTQTLPSPPSLQIILQDPAYTDIDRTLISSILFPSNRRPKFVDDPDGMLAIDSRSLVVAPHLDLNVPLMQIIADLFWDDLSRAPVGIISDGIGSIEGKRTFCATDRVTPRVDVMLQLYDEIWDEKTLEEWGELLESEKRMGRWFLEMFSMVRVGGGGRAERKRGEEWPLSEVIVRGMG